MADRLSPGKTLFIVARHNEHLYASLRRTFAGDETVEIILDRRAAGRRRGKDEDEARRARERRYAAAVESQLRRRGWAIVVPAAR